jgi:hypothetical protein
MSMSSMYPTFEYEKRSPGAKEQALRKHGVQKLLSRPRPVGMCTNRPVIFRQRPVVAEAARVTKQMRLRDRGGNVHLWQPLPHGIAESERSNLD